MAASLMNVGERPRRQHMDVDGRRRASVDELRLAPGSSFKYNARMSVALLPCIALMLGMGGKPVLGTLTVGLMISYILDSLLLKRGAFFGVWGTLGATAVAYALSGISFSSTTGWPLQALSLLVLMELVFLVGVWASLQFKWLHLENPSVVLALERLLFACTPFVAATCQTWGVVAAMGLEHSSFYLMGIQFVLYWLFSLPKSSSFRTKLEKSYGGQISEESLLMGPLEGCLHTLMLLFLPLVLHVGIHHSRLVSTNVLCELLLLFFVPLLFQLYASTRGALWWLVRDQRQLHQVRVVNGALSLIIVIICLEIRVVFYAFNQYIQIPPPLNYLLVTSAFLGAAAAVGFYLLGHLKHVHMAGLLVVAALSSSLVVGMPLKFLPAPLISAICLAHYITTKNLISYSVCVLSASVSITWFMAHNFWFLNIWIGGIPLKSICKLILGSAILAMSIPGLTALPAKAHFVVDVALVAHAVLICNLENRLFNYASMYYFGMDEDVVYPSYMVVVSTVVGLVLTRRMAAETRISSLGSWVLYCLYFSKLSMLLLSSKSVLWASAILLLAISPPVLLYKDKGKGVTRMKPWQGVAHAAVIFISIWSCRNTVSEALQWWSGRHPSDSLLLGSIILLSGLASAPIVVYHFNHIQSARRTLVLVLTTGILCVLLQPPLPSAWSFSRDSVYALEHLADDEAIYGTMAGAKPRWPTWLLLLTVVASLAAVTSALPVQHFVTLRLIYAAGVGTNIGLYVCAQYFPGVLLIQALLLVALICASVSVVFVLLPSASSPRFVPWVFALLVALLPVIYMLEGQLRGGSTGRDTGEEERLLSMLALRGARTSLLGVYAAIFMLIALVIKLQLTSLLKERVHEKQQKDQSSHAGFVPKHRLLQQRASPLTVRKLAAAEGTWMPAAGNVATLLCFIICIVLNKHLAGGSDRAILFLAPILLLLNQDTNLLTGFGDRQRYLPLSAAISLYLAVSAAYRVWGEVWHGYQNAGWGLETGGPGLFFAAKNTLLLALTLPNHALFNFFLWNYVKQSDFVLLLTSPLSIPALVTTDVSAIRALALLAILYALVQYMISRHIRIAGMKYI